MIDRSKDTLPTWLVDEASQWQFRLETPTPETVAEFSRWRDADPLHAEAFEAVCGNWTDSEIVVETPVGRDRKLVQAPFYMRHSVRVAAGTCLGLLLATGLVIAVAGMNQRSVISSAKAASFETGIGEIRTFSLGDGTVVTLDTASALRTIAGRPRSVELLKGRARFAPPRGREAFTVVTARGSVRAQGASFDVSLIGAHPRVSAISGRTELKIAGASGAPVFLGEGQQGGLESGGTVQKVVEGQLLWVKGMLVFDATPLEEAVAAMNRYNKTRIELRRPTGDHRVTGAFSVREPDAFASAVAALFSLETAHSSDGTIILRRP